MIRKISNWVCGSFFRTIGRILVYILFGLLLAYLLKDIKLPGLFYILRPIEVDALQIGGTEFMTPSDFQLYNNLSLTNSSGITTTKGAFTGTGIVYGYGTVSTTTSGYGASWCMNSNIVFLQNYIYSVQIAVLNENNKSYNIVTNDSYDMLRLGYTLSDASTHRNSTNILYFGAYYDNHGVYVDGNQMFNKAYVLNYLFTSKLNSQYICLPFRHTQNTSNEQEFFFGYKIDVIGQSDLVTNASISSAISSSGLASASSVAQVQSSINQVQQEINGINDTLTDDDTDESIDEASDFFSNFSTSTHGLTGIITAPLSAIQSLSSSTCTPLTLPLPFVNQNITLPCMRQIYDQHFGTFMQIYDVITLGIVAYWVCVRIFSLVKDFKNPEHDEIEVVDL